MQDLKQELKQALRIDKSLSQNEINLLTIGSNYYVDKDARIKKMKQKKAELLNVSKI
jgi:hypothetical protein